MLLGRGHVTTLANCDNKFSNSTTNIDLALYNRADSVVVTSNVREHAENIGIYNSISNVYLQ